MRIWRTLKDVLKLVLAKSFVVPVNLLMYHEHKLHRNSITCRDERHSNFKAKPSCIYLLQKCNKCRFYGYTREAALFKQTLA